MNVEMISEWIAAGCILAGTILTLLSAIGLIRLPDVYTRSHAASKSTTLGVLFVLLGAFMFFWIAEGYVSIRLLLGIFFVFLTAPVAGHIICRAAYRSDVKLADRTVRDDLKKLMKAE
ncbi:MAG: monovalent cation/H(+) antiporter subunit G [Bacillus sp. (in: firmicutes)]